MKTSRLTTLAAGAVLMSAFTTGSFAQHAERCEPIPKAEWRPQADLERKLKDEGWTVSRIKIENGCYEVYGKDAKGKRLEAFFHPGTFEIVTARK